MIKEKRGVRGGRQKWRLEWAENRRNERAEKWWIERCGKDRDRGEGRWRGGEASEVRMRWCNWCGDSFRQVFHMLSVPAGQTALRNEPCERQVVWPWHWNVCNWLCVCVSIPIHTYYMDQCKHIAPGGIRVCVCLPSDDYTSHHRACRSYWGKQLKKLNRGLMSCNLTPILCNSHHSLVWTVMWTVTNVDSLQDYLDSSCLSIRGGWLAGSGYLRVTCASMRWTDWKKRLYIDLLPEMKPRELT